MALLLEVRRSSFHELLHERGYWPGHTVKSVNENN
jgi:hypothetical protein